MEGYEAVGTMRDVTTHPPYQHGWTTHTHTHTPLTLSTLAMVVRAGSPTRIAAGISNLWADDVDVTVLVLREAREKGG
jgi:ABC-type sulfate transport system substrate-binding protein